MTDHRPPLPDEQLQLMESRVGRCTTHHDACDCIAYRYEVAYRQVYEEVQHLREELQTETDALEAMSERMVELYEELGVTPGWPQVIPEIRRLKREHEG